MNRLERERFAKTIKKWREDVRVCDMCYVMGRGKKYYRVIENLKIDKYPCRFHYGYFGENNRWSCCGSPLSYAVGCCSQHHVSLPHIAADREDDNVDLENDWPDKDYLIYTLRDTMQLRASAVSEFGLADVIGRSNDADEEAWRIVRFNQEELEKAKTNVNNRCFV